MTKKYIAILSTTLCVVLTLSACGGGGSDGGGDIAGGNTGVQATTFSLAGQIQKGPFIFGTNIWVAELNTHLNPNGKTYLSQTSDDLGSFSVSSTVSTHLVEILADGYFLDETTGSLSTAKNSLRAIADLSVDDTPTVNILTTLQSSRLKYLMTSLDYTFALAQSQAEVLAIFEITDGSVNNLDGLFAMQIDGNNDSDAVLLATSAIMMQMAATEALANSSSSSAELSFFVSQIAEDIQLDGVLDSSTIKAKLTNAAKAVNLSAVRSNLETYYSNQGVTLTAPKFEEWIDKDGSDILPRRLIPVTGLSFTNVAGQESLQVITSNNYEVTGLGTNVFASVEGSSNATMIKNGVPVSGAFTTVHDGDILSLKITSGKLDESVTASINVGSITEGWTVDTKTPEIGYFSGVGNFPTASIPGDDPEKFHALPISINSPFTGKYLATTFGYVEMGSTTGVPSGTKISIFSDNAGVPGSALITSTNFQDHFGTASLNITSSGNQKSNWSSYYTQTFLGSSGLPVSPGDDLWVVIEFPTAYDPGSGGNAPVGFSARKVSSDGITWSNYAGNANGRYSDQMPQVVLTN